MILENTISFTDKKELGDDAHMKVFIETDDKYIIQRWRKVNTHKDSVFCVEIYPGVVTEFGEPKSKLGSRRYDLQEISFLKERYSRDGVDTFWKERFYNTGALSSDTETINVGGS